MCDEFRFRTTELCCRSGHVIFLAALISVAKLFTIAYTRGTNVFTEYIDDLSVYFD